jgi:hypothetical protein
METLLGTENPVSFAGGSYFEVTNLRMLPPLRQQLFPEILNSDSFCNMAQTRATVTAALAHRSTTALEGTPRRTDQPRGLDRRAPPRAA